MSRYKGFTTIELLVVIGILVVLGAIVFVGVHHVGRSSQESSTRQTLANLQGMLADLDTTTKLAKQPFNFLWTWDGATIVRAKDVNPTHDFWRGLPIPTAGTGTVGFALASPGAVAEGGLPIALDQRNASLAVVNTNLAMTLLASLPDNRSRLQALPQPQQFVPEWKDGNMTMPNGGQAQTRYVPNVFVKHLGRIYRATQAFPTSGNATPGSGSEWADVTAQQPPAPLLLDAWNNPVIFVPATGLRVKLKADPSKEFIVVSPEGEANNTLNPPTVVRAGRPFFASAGADGDFTAGDDNVYSFEK